MVELAPTTPMGATTADVDQDSLELTVKMVYMNVYNYVYVILEACWRDHL